MEKIHINTEFIKLDQFLKWADLVGSGSDAKFLIKNKCVRVNGNIIDMRGKKLYKGDIVEVEFDGNKFKFSVE